MKTLLAIYVLLNGQPIEFKDAQPFIEKSTLMVPLRGVFEAMDATVKYTPKHREIDIETADSHVHFGLDARNIKLKNPQQRADIDVVAAQHYYKYLPLIKNQRAYVPLRFVAEALGAKVVWNNATRTASITMNQPSSTPGIRAGEIEVRAMSDKSTYRAGEAVEFTITAINQDEQPRTLNFRSGQSFDIFIADNTGRVLWQWSHDRAFTQALREVMLQPGQAMQWREVWNQQDNAGGQVPPGEYTVQARLATEPDVLAPPFALELTR